MIDRRASFSDDPYVQLERHHAPLDVHSHRRPYACALEKQKLEQQGKVALYKPSIKQVRQVEEMLWRDWHCPAISHFSQNFIAITFIVYYRPNQH